MPDKDHKTGESSLVDKGWEQMLQRLDAEMPLPEEKRKRRFLFFWIFLGLGLLGAATLSLWDEINGSVTELGKFEIPTNEAQQIISLKSAGTVDLVSEENKEINNQALPTPNLASPNTTKTLNSPAILWPNQVEDLLADTTILSKPQAKAVENSSAPPILEAFNSENQAFNNLNLIDTPEPLLAYAFNDDLERLEPAEIPLKGMILNFGVDLGVLANSGFDRTGTSAGLFIQLSGKRSRWGIQTGFSYWNTPEVVPLTGSVAIRDTVYYQGDLVGAEDVGTSFLTIDSIERNYTLPAPFIESFQLQHFRLPILATYKVNPKIQLEAGIELAYLFREISFVSQDELTADNNAEPNIFAGGVTVERFSFSSISNLTINQLDLATRLGISYQFYKSLGIRASYHHGWGNILPGEYGKNHSRQFQFAAYWRF